MIPIPLGDEERRLIALAQTGDESAWTVLCQGCTQSLYRFLYFRVGQREADAQDLLQDVLMVAVERLTAFRPEGSFYGWLIGIARHKLLHYYRAQGRRQAMEVALDRLDDEMTGWDADRVSVPHLESLLAQRQWPHLMAAALSALSARDQELLLKKYADGHTIEELAEALGSHPKAMASALQRAKTAFAYAFHQLSHSEVFQGV